MGRCFQQIASGCRRGSAQGGPQIGFSRNLLASLNLLEITRHDRV